MRAPRRKSECRITGRRRTGALARPLCWAAAAWLVLSAPAAAKAASVAVVPILIGPLQVLLSILPAILGAIVVALISMVVSVFKPSAIKAGLKLLWRKKIQAGLFVAAVVGVVYLLSYAFAAGQGPVGQAVTGAAEWPAYRGGPERRGSAGDAPDPLQRAIVWTFADGKVKTFYSSPAVTGNRVYVATADKGVFADSGAICCLDADTKGVAWRYAPRGFRATYSSPAVAEGHVVCGEGLHFTRDARITCLNADTGQRVWELRTQSHVESSPCIYEGKVYVGAGDDGLYCVALAPTSAGEPNVIWHLSGKDYPDCETSPIAHEGKVYFGLGEGGCAVVCVDAATGRQLWRTPAPYPVFGSPTLAEGRLFVGLGNGNMIDTAEVVREKKIKRMREAGVDEAEIVKRAADLGPAGEIWCLDPNDGKVIWKHRLPRTVLGAVAAADGRLYFGCRDGRLYCLTTDNEPVGRPFDAHDPIVTSPAVGRNHVYFVTQNGRLYCLDRRTLRRVWDMPVGTAGPFLSSPAVARGHVYLGTSADGLLCVGRPADKGLIPTWPGSLGGPSRAGWADGSPLPERTSFAWRYPKTSSSDEAAVVHAPAAWLDGAIYVGVQAGEKIGLTKLTQPQATGRRRKEPKQEWFYPTPNPLHHSVAIRGRRIYFVDGQAGQTRRHLHCVHASDGRGLWKHPVTPGAGGQVLLAGRYLLAAYDADKIACIELSADPTDDTYQMRWSQKVPRPVGPPAVADETVLVASATPPAVTALGLADGSEKWHARLPAAATTGCVSREGLVAVGTAKGLTVLSLSNGALLWSADRGAVAGLLTADEDHLACATANGEALIFAWTGRPVARIDNARARIAPMLLGEKALVVVAGNFECVDLDTGRRRRWYKADWLGEVTAAPILADSHLYFGTARKGLVCVRPRK